MLTFSKKIYLLLPAAGAGSVLCLEIIHVKYYQPYIEIAQLALRERRHEPPATIRFSASAHLVHELPAAYPIRRKPELRRLLVAVVIVRRKKFLFLLAVHEMPGLYFAVPVAGAAFLFIKLATALGVCNYGRRATFARILGLRRNNRSSKRKADRQRFHPVFLILSLHTLQIMPKFDVSISPSHMRHFSLRLLFSAGSLNIAIIF